MKYKHKKTGKLYDLVQEKILFKDIEIEPELCDGEYYEQNKYHWRGKDKENFVLYKALYDNPDGPYFIRHKKDWEDNFEKCINDKEKKLFENAVCGTKYTLRNGDSAFYVNHTNHSFSHSASHLLAYNGHIFEYNDDGMLLYQDEVHIDYLPEMKYPGYFKYSAFDIVERID